MIKRFWRWLWGWFWGYDKPNPERCQCGHLRCFHVGIDMGICMKTWCNCDNFISSYSEINELERIAKL